MLDLPPLPPTVLEPMIRRALDEDFGNSGDVTANLLIPAAHSGKLYMKARDTGVIAGLQAAQMTYAMVDPTVRFDVQLNDGTSVKPGDIIATVEGPARSLLAAERTALNFLGRMSGVATLTARYVAAVKGTKARIAATRKTTPGLRALEKRAVLAGGGFTHRQSLSDAIMIKDNHIALAGSIEATLAAINANADHMIHISVEVDTLEQMQKALPFHPDVILLDNMNAAQITKAVAIADAYDGRRPTLEASGGINLDTVAGIAKTGINVISVGALTHSAKNFDVGMDAA